MKSRLSLIYLTLIAILFAILQADFIPFIYFYGTGPDLLLLLCASIGFCTETGGFTLAAILSMAIGIIAGAFSSMNPAYFIILFELSALISYRLGKRRISKIFMLILSGFAVSIISVLFSFLFLYASGDPESANDALRKLTAYSICNIIFILPIHLIPKSFARKKSIL